MTQPDGRTGSTAFPGTPLPGQPLAEQPTGTVAYPPVHEQAAPVQPAPSAFLARPHDEPDDEPSAVARQDTDPGLTLPAPPVEDPTATRPDYRDAPVVVRRADDLAGLLLLLAGIAAGVSLLVVWVDGGATGLDLVRAGVDDLRTGPAEVVDRGSWHAPAVVLGGAVLFVLGLLLFAPAKTHRFLGALALLVTLVVAAGVLVPLADAGWDVEAWAVGAWFTVATGALGFLGALKALMTGPHSRRR
jgi:hypothetical protein